MENGVIYAIISIFFAGITSVLAQFGMKGVSSDTALAIRTSVVFIWVISNAFIFRNAFAEIQHTHLKNIIFRIFSGSTTSLSWIFY